MQEQSGALFAGRIYIAGGFDSADAPTAVAYRYDPAHNVWARIAIFRKTGITCRSLSSATRCTPSAGLEGQQFVPQTTLWIYRADRNTWETRAPLPAPRGASAAVAVNGKLIVVGGFGVNRTLLDSIAVYDPATNHWVNRAPIPTRRDHLTAGVVGGIVYAIGGRPLDPGKNFDVTEAYDPAADRWTTKTPMPSPAGRSRVGGGGWANPHFWRRAAGRRVREP